MRFCVAVVLAGVSVLAATTALAQAPQVADEVQSTSAQSGQLADIIVTAQRREESLQNVPVAVTAIGAEQLDQLRVTNVRALTGIAPNLQINTQGLQSNPTIIIRGVASGTSNNAVDPKVGIYLDGVYIGRTVGSVFDLSDIQRVEVLRGPQGTLFGRNATSGAISLTTAAPTGKFGVRGSVSYGNYDAKRGKVSVDLPSFGPLAIKFSYLHDDIRGDYRNAIGGSTIDFSQIDPSFGKQHIVRRLGGRNVDGVGVAARLDLGGLTADYRFDYTDARSSGRAIQSRGVIPDSSGALLSPIIAFQSLFGGITNISPDRLATVANASSIERVVTQGHSLTLSYPLNDAITLKSITALRKFRQDPNIYDLAASGGLKFTTAQLQALLVGNVAGVLNPANAPGPNDSFFSLMTARSTRQKQFSQEFQVQLTSDKVDLTAGLFYFHENSPADDYLGIFQPVANGVVIDMAKVGLIAGLPVGQLPFDLNRDGVINAADSNPSLASLFGSGMTRTRAINDSYAAYGQITWHLTDTLDATGGLRYTKDERENHIYEVSGGQGGQLGVGDYKVNYKKATWAAILTWRPTQRVTAYGKVSTGYVAGGILSGIPYRPETLTAYELGLKTQTLGNRLRTNIALFYSDYKDLQTQNFINGRQFFNNAGKADIKGVEIEADFVPVRGLTLSGNLSYTDFGYKSFILNGVDVADVARTTFASKWQGRASVQYDAPDMTMGGHLSGRIDGRYRSRLPLVSTPFYDMQGNLAPLNQYAYQKGFWVVDGRIGWVDMPLGGTKASLSLFGQNLLNKHYTAFGSPVLQLVATYDRGRTYGVELGFAF
ncbi:TonB-dependent receptor [Sphingobium sp. EM0848]|uniref:TonB-dependent receptor n=1 Tax=Sphingobium sp. EM0848 TaxID=2743473 RepID=UPI00159C41B5|nr:TonB-dependent receptor [Sphingobium sp. EM0848]